MAHARILLGLAALRMTWASTCTMAVINSGVTCLALTGSGSAATGGGGAGTASEAMVAATGPAAAATAAAAADAARSGSCCCCEDELSGMGVSAGARGGVEVASGREEGAEVESGAAVDEVGIGLDSEPSAVSGIGSVEGALVGGSEAGWDAGGGGDAEGRGLLLPGAGTLARKRRVGAVAGMASEGSCSRGVEEDGEEGKNVLAVSWMSECNTGYDHMTHYTMYDE